MPLQTYQHGFRIGNIDRCSLQSKDTVPRMGGREDLDIVEFGRTENESPEVGKHRVVDPIFDFVKEEKRTSGILLDVRVEKESLARF